MFLIIALMCMFVMWLLEKANFAIFTTNEMFMPLYIWGGFMVLQFVLLFGLASFMISKGLKITSIKFRV